MKIDKCIFIWLIFFVSPFVSAQNCDAPQSTEQVRIYFVNGMNNTFLGLEAEEQHMIVSKDKLAQLVGPNVGAFGNSFNFKEDVVAQVMQVAKQRGTQPIEFWQWMAYMHRDDPLHFVPLEAQQAAFNTEIKKTKELNDKYYFTDKDLQVMVNQYLLDLQSGKKVVLVAHSQGNFYANNTYIHIKTNYPQYTNSIGIVMAASPASINASGGPHTNNTEDKILKGVKAVYPILSYTGSYIVPPNIDKTKVDKNNHNFNLAYLADWGGGKGGAEIKQNILNMIGTLKLPVKHIDCATDAEIPVQIATWSATNIIATSAQLNGFLTSGKNVYVWFNSRIGNSDVASCSSTRSVYPGGTGQVDQYYLNKAFPSSANVYYRACAIGVGNRISEGIVVNFQTLAAPPPPISTTRNINVCGSWDTSLISTGLSSYQAIGGAVNGVAFGNYGFNPGITSPQCRVAQVKRSFTNSFVFYLTSTKEGEIYRLYRFRFYDENGQYMNRECGASWTLQNRTSSTCHVAF